MGGSVARGGHRHEAGIVRSRGAGATPPWLLWVALVTARPAAERDRYLAVPRFHFGWMEWYVTDTATALVVAVHRHRAEARAHAYRLNAKTKGGFR